MTKIFNPKITPGPWEVHQKLNVTAPKLRGIATNAFSSNQDGAFEESLENMIAIAAVPELLKVLEAARKVLKKGPIPPFGPKAELYAAIKALDEKHGKEVG